MTKSHFLLSPGSDMMSFLLPIKKIFRFRPLEKVMAAQSHAMPADIQLLHINIVEKMKNSKSFEMQFFDLKRCLAVSMTFLHSDNTIFREKLYVSCFLNIC